MTVPLIVAMVSAAIWLVVTLAESPGKALAWLGEAARLTFFAAIFVTLLGLSGKAVF